MKTLPVIVSLHSAGVLLNLNAAAASLLSTVVSGPSQDYVVPVAGYPVSNVGVKPIPTHLLTNRRLGPVSHATMSQSVLPAPSQYGHGPVLYYSYGFSPSVHDVEHQSTDGSEGTEEADVPSARRSAEEIHAVSHTLPAINYIDNVGYVEKPQLSELSQDLSVNAHADLLQYAPFLYRARLMREEKVKTAPTGHETKTYEGERAERDDVEVARKDRKKKKGNVKGAFTVEERIPGEQKGQEKLAGETGRIQGVQKQSRETEKEWDAAQEGEVGCEGEEKKKGREGGAEENDEWSQKQEQPADNAGNRRRPYSDFHEAAPAYTVSAEKEEKWLRFPRRSSAEDESPNGPADGAEEKGMVAVEVKRQTTAEVPAKSCAGVCKVEVQRFRHGGAKGNAGEAKHEPEPSRQRSPAAAPGENAGTRSEKDETEGEAGYGNDSAGQAGPGLRLKSAPDSIHLRKMESELLEDRTGGSNRMRNLGHKKKYSYYPKTYVSRVDIPVVPVPWYPAYESGWWTNRFHEFYPVSRYYRWLREDVSATKDDPNTSGHEQDGGPSGQFSHAYVEEVN